MQVSKSGYIVLSAILVLLIGYACHGHHGSTAALPPGTYAVYGTDDPLDTSGTNTTDGTVTNVTGTGTDGTISGDTGTTMLSSGGSLTITSFTLADTSGAATAEMLNQPIRLDFASLQNTMQFISIGNAPDGAYNRIRIEFNKNVELFSTVTNTTFACTVTDYKENGSTNQPDVVHCSDTERPDICWIDLNGAVQLLANGTNKIGLGFDLKNFVVNDPGMPDCTVTMKISPLNASGIAKLGRPEAAVGLVSGLTQTSFVLTAGNKTFNILYSDPELHATLEDAQAETLRVRVAAPTIDLTGQPITATKISVLRY